MKVYVITEERYNYSDSTWEILAVCGSEDAVDRWVSSHRPLGGKGRTWKEDMKYPEQTSFYPYHASIRCRAWDQVTSSGRKVADYNVSTLVMREFEIER